MKKPACLSTNQQHKYCVKQRSRREDAEQKKLKTQERTVERLDVEYVVQKADDF